MIVGRPRDKEAMRIVIFAGGTGRRLWPISRASSPKQFEPIVGNASTLQLAVARVAPIYSFDSIFIATNARYLPIVREQLQKAGIRLAYLLNSTLDPEYKPASGPAAK